MSQSEGKSNCYSDVESRLDPAVTVPKNESSAEFVRINVYTGARLADQGILQGEAQKIARYRRALGSAAQIWADVAKF